MKRRKEIGDERVEFHAVTVWCKLNLKKIKQKMESSLREIYAASLIANPRAENELLINIRLFWHARYLQFRLVEFNYRRYYSIEKWHNSILHLNWNLYQVLIHIRSEQILICTDVKVVLVHYSDLISFHSIPP